MRSVTAIVLLDFVDQANAKDLALNHTDNLVDKLVNQALKVSPLHHVHLDRRTRTQKPNRPFLPTQFAVCASTPCSSLHVPHSPHLASQLQNPSFRSPPICAKSSSEDVLYLANRLTHTAPLFLPQGSVSIERIPEDPDRLFNALHYGLLELGLEEVWNEDGAFVRKRIAEFILNNPDCPMYGTFIKDWILWYSGETVEKYVKDLLEGKFVGDTIEMRVFCKVWNVNLGLYKPDAQGTGHLNRILGLTSWNNPSSMGAVRGLVMLYELNQDEDPLDEQNKYDVLIPDKTSSMFWSTPPPTVEDIYPASLFKLTDLGLPKDTRELNHRRRVPYRVSDQKGYKRRAPERKIPGPKPDYEEWLDRLPKMREERMVAHASPNFLSIPNVALVGLLLGSGVTFAVLRFRQFSLTLRKEPLMNA